MSRATDTIATITAHHEELQTALSERVDAVTAAVRQGGPHQAAVRDLDTLLTAEIIPHARAEEEVLYAAAIGPSLRPLVAGMLLEHETLLSLASELGWAPTPVDKAGVARAVREVFVGHVRRENDLLLPALDADPDIDLPALLPTLQERFSAYQSRSRAR